eukprot:TRINITY_DN7326_c0_g1_i2.p1 TRINITY_DN7326_c0_g1~~TRINITY_DN7326_c0_g1_i2.p1  ORF type:complete len:721 (-),score=153.58 TRINITY_DN7326_c0_g1_i2:117-2279(-)
MDLSCWRQLLRSCQLQFPNSPFKNPILEKALFLCCSIFPKQKLQPICMFRRKSEASNVLSDSNSSSIKKLSVHLELILQGNKYIANFPFTTAGTNKSTKPIPKIEMELQPSQADDGRSNKQSHEIALAQSPYRPNAMHLTIAPKISEIEVMATIMKEKACIALHLQCNHATKVRLRKECYGTTKKRRTGCDDPLRSTEMWIALGYLDHAHRRMQLCPNGWVTSPMGIIEFKPDRKVVLPLHLWISIEEIYRKLNRKMNGSLCLFVRIRMDIEDKELMADIPIPSTSLHRQYPIKLMTIGSKHHPAPASPNDPSLLNLNEPTSLNLSLIPHHDSFSKLMRMEEQILDPMEQFDSALLFEEVRRATWWDAKYDDGVVLSWEGALRDFPSVEFWLFNVVRYLNPAMFQVVTNMALFLQMKLRYQFFEFLKRGGGDFWEFEDEYLFLASFHGESNHTRFFLHERPPLRIDHRDDPKHILLCDAFRDPLPHRWKTLAEEGHYPLTSFLLIILTARILPKRDAHVDHLKYLSLLDAGLPLNEKLELSPLGIPDRWTYLEGMLLRNALPIQLMEELIQMGADLNTGQVLYAAARLDDEAYLEKALQAGANIDCIDKWDMTQLGNALCDIIISSRYGRERKHNAHRTIERLIDAGADTTLTLNHLIQYVKIRPCEEFFNWNHSDRLLSVRGLPLDLVEECISLVKEKRKEAEKGQMATLEHRINLLRI